MLLILRIVYTWSFFMFSMIAVAQYNPQFYLRYTESAERQKAYNRLIERGILQNLSTSLNEDTEEEWQAAFMAMEVTGYHDNFTRQKLEEAMQALPHRSITFQRRTLEAAYVLYPGAFVKEAERLMYSTTEPRIFAMCAVYLFKSDSVYANEIRNSVHERFADSLHTQPTLSRLQTYLDKERTFEALPRVLNTLLSKHFLPGQTILYSFQRKNRDQPGLAMVRKGNGDFVQLEGELFHVKQLARGIADLPYFLPKGNTPQGLYRMFGFGVSQSQFIGPTANVQMGMPVELTKGKFFNRSDTSFGPWSISDYAKLLPPALQTFEPLYDSYHAGRAGRNEIIAHGTTINPEFYRGRDFYPLTPSEGCLSTRELWDGKIIDSDQQRLVNALLAAGGAYGYVVVIEIDDQEAPVSHEEILKYIP